jgi:hypothetical protein
MLLKLGKILHKIFILFHCKQDKFFHMYYVHTEKFAYYPLHEYSSLCNVFSSKSAKMLARTHEGQLSSPVLYLATECLKVLHLREL